MLKAKLLPAGVHCAWDFSHLAFIKPKFKLAELRGLNDISASTVCPEMTGKLFSACRSQRNHSQGLGLQAWVHGLQASSTPQSVRGLFELKLNRLGLSGNKLPSLIHASEPCGRLHSLAIFTVHARQNNSGYTTDSISPLMADWIAPGRRRPHSTKADSPTLVYAGVSMA